MKTKKIIIKDDISELPEPRPSEINIDDIYVSSDFNCRNDFTTESIITLAENIKVLGLLCRLGVRKIDPEIAEGKPFHLIQGHRRYAALKYLGWKTAPVNIYDEIDEYDAMRINLSENIERDDLTIMEEARQLGLMYPGMTVTQICRSINRDTKWVYRRLRLLRADKRVQNAADAGRLSQHQLDDILLYDNKDNQVQIMNQCLKANEGVAKLTGGFENKLKGRASKIRNYKQAPIPNRNEVLEILSTVLNAGIIGLAPRLLAYTQGWITRDQILEDINNIRPIAEFANEPRKDS